MIVLDSNVVSELMRERPSSTVVQWARSQVADEVCTTSVTVAEVRFGIERLPDGGRKDLLRSTADEIFTQLTDVVWPFDTKAAERYADIVARRERAGRPTDGFDAQIAAICHTRRADLATRHVSGFADTGIRVIDPWQFEG